MLRTAYTQMLFSFILSYLSQSNLQYTFTSLPCIYTVLCLTYALWHNYTDKPQSHDHPTIHHQTKKVWQAVDQNSACLWFLNWNGHNSRVIKKPPTATENLNNKYKQKMKMSKCPYSLKMYKTPLQVKKQNQIWVKFWSPMQNKNLNNTNRALKYGLLENFKI